MAEIIFLQLNMISVGDAPSGIISDFVQIMPVRLIAWYCSLVVSSKRPCFGWDIYPDGDACEDNPSDDRKRVGQLLAGMGRKRRARREGCVYASTKRGPQSVLWLGEPESDSQ